MHSDIASSYSQRKAALVRRYAFASKAVLIFGVALVIILVVVCTTLFTQDMPDPATQMLTVITVVAAVFIIMFFAVSISCLHSAKKKALALLAAQCRVEQPRRRQQRNATSKNAFESPPPYDSLFDIHGMGISANNSTANFSSFPSSPNTDCPVDSFGASGDGCTSVDSGGGGFSGGDSGGGGGGGCSTTD